MSLVADVGSLSELPTVTVEEGAIKQLGLLLDRFHARRPLLVVDMAAFVASGAAPIIGEALDGREAALFCEFDPNPKLKDVRAGVDCFRRHRPDVVIALGGGSALDMGKLVGFCGAQSGDPLDYIRARLKPERAPLPLIAIPTTAGTGSEATHFAVVYVDGEKFSFADPELLPSWTILDPGLTAKLPSGIAAASGLDAFSQAIESIWATGATETSLSFAREGCRLAFGHLERAVAEGASEDRIAMMRAAHYSGKAINISKTTAPHAISYAITTRFGVPHGAAVGLTLGTFLRFNSDIDPASCVDSRGPEEVRKRIEEIVALLGGGGVDRVCRRIQLLIKNIGMPVRLRDVGATMRDLSLLADEVNSERLSNNPRNVSHAQIQELLESLL